MLDAGMVNWDGALGFWRIFGFFLGGGMASEVLSLGVMSNGEGCKLI